ncbi:unnamed protein product [Schistocephalus solidus]|uniref:DUF4325 domain-containing protein n=1 Tax=Schistocephalus solidus TaxID=70667 RepID=A0A183TPY5_SCHSO|nr:unnamed protein product [Schistocephalus solidus]
MKQTHHLAGGRDQSGCSAVSAEATLAFHEQALSWVTIRTIEKDTGEYLPGDVEQRDAFVIVTEFPVSLSFVERDNGRVFLILRNLSLAPHLLEEWFELCYQPGLNELVVLREEAVFKILKSL